ncbi:MAG TPA: 30S ribosome-binding factor RbfA [Armatimonadetes bacterium]|nr:30S ribosome-binding factor RbfA [Armatimonadota bacterium]
MDRVNELLRETISEIILMELRDPRVNFVTITEARVSPDLRHCRVYYTVYGDEQARKRAQEGLEHAANFIRQEVNRRVRLKFIPELHFEFDERIERGMHVIELLDEIAQEINEDEEWDSESEEEYEEEYNWASDVHTEEDK